MAAHDARGPLSVPAVWRGPVGARIADTKCISMPPPTLGRHGLLEMLNVLEGDDLAAHGAGSAQPFISWSKRCGAHSPTAPRFWATRLQRRHAA